MSTSKGPIEDRRELEIVALYILRVSGALRECEYHPGFFLQGNQGLESAFELAGANLDTEQLTLPDGTTSSDFIEIIGGVYSNQTSAGSCAACAEAEKGHS